MKARTYAVAVNGETPLLLHNDNISWSETMKRWSTDPGNRSKSVAGDDRSPPWRWLGCLYVDGGLLCVPADNLMTVMREGGKRCPTGKGQQTFKSQSQSGIVINEAAWPLQINGKLVKFDALASLETEEDFAAHEKLAQDLGFMLFVKRAKIGAAKHVRVRPRFDHWAMNGTLTVLDEAITTDVLRNIWQFAGCYAGLGDWRPSSPKSPGSFGKFTVKIAEAV